MKHLAAYMLLVLSGNSKPSKFYAPLTPLQPKSK